MKNLTIITMLFLLAGCAAKQHEIKLPALIADHMVLQQNAKVNLWGWSDPKAKIGINTSWGAVAEAVTGADGKWLATLETPAFGGPYTVTFKAGETEKIISNVMVGEVWLCSGQSNMEMPLKGWPPNDTINFSASEIASADYPGVRMFTVAKSTSGLPQDNCSGSWVVSSPSTAGDFSASAYFFGLKLHKELGIPVGLIHSSWGGTPAESWTSGELIGTVPGYESFAAEMQENQQNLKEFEAFLAKLENIPFEKLPKENPFADLNLNDSAYLVADISGWKDMTVPQTWENAGLPGFDGVVWFIRDFEYDGSVYPEGIELHLGPVDDMDATYLNGQKIGSNEMSGVWSLERVYSISADLLKKGTNRIAVKVTDNQGGGGIYGKQNPAIVKGDKVLADLGGAWKYKPAATFKSGTVYVYGEGEKSYDGFTGKTLVMNEYTPTMLYNAMIAPLVPYTLQGAIWYQGESNVGRGKQYESLFPAMITSWRKAWNQGDFPFYYVQIAPYNYGDNANETTAELRDAQFKTLSLVNTGMAVTMDIGNPVNIHPANKKDVGERLALWALDKTYKKEGVVCSGPLFKNAVFNGNQAEVEFDYATGLVLAGSESFFEIAGVDGVFYPAKATVANDKIVAVADKVKEAKQIRYAWADDCEPNLFNGAGLPASPFKSDLK